MLLKDRVAIITGASRGIGAATALRYAREGACVVVNFAHNADASNAIIEKIKLDGGRAVAVCADVSDAKAVAAMVEQTGSVSYVMLGDKYCKLQISNFKFKICLSAFVTGRHFACLPSSQAGNLQSPMAP